MQIQFEECFGYELTPDQKEAVKEIKADMEMPRPMDRLVMWRCWFWENRSGFTCLLLRLF